MLRNINLEKRISNKRITNTLFYTILKVSNQEISAISVLYATSSGDNHDRNCP